MSATLPTIALNPLLIDGPLPASHEELMNLLYGAYSDAAKKVRQNNRALDERCNEIYVNPSIEGMLRQPTWDEIASVMPAKVVLAAMFGNLNYQVENGGFMQWDGNGYSAKAAPLIQIFEIAAEIGIEGAEPLAKILNEFLSIKRGEDHYHAHYDDEDDDETGAWRPFEALDAAYYDLKPLEIMQQILDRFDEIEGRIVRRTMLPLAA